MRKILLFAFLILCSISYSQDRLDAAKAEIQNYLDEKQERISNFLEVTPSFDRSKVNQIWDIINGQPIFVESDNETAIIATRLNHLQPDGSLGLDLTGLGMTMGIWEVGGIPQSTHAEFNDDNGISRVQVVDDIGSNFHATHVAGTMIARGNNEQAQGMAVDASLVAYDNINDVQEALAEASENGLLISNHSYGIPVDGVVDVEAEWLMGAYVDSARLWDVVTFNERFYLPIKSAGNGGNDEYDGGIALGFDKLTGNKVAKNALIVANASQVGVIPGTGQFFFANINSSSSQGPTDDGRIKPDIAGYGTGVLSTAPGGGYGIATGTSMSAPNVSGSALLLQELYFNTNENYMLAQTLKGLISVTADDAGPEGPDQFSGWGLMNSKRAAEAILDNGTNDIILEDELESGETRTLRISYNSEEKLKVAVAWTDPAGQTATPNVFNDPTPRLVNDLDLRLTNIANDVQSFPWKLNQNNLTSEAITGDNNVDNIEIIELDQPGTYDVVISHKGDLLTGSQSYSFIALNAVEESLSIDEFSTSSFTVWPNPAKNTLNISAINNFNNNIQVQIVDMLGRTIQSNDFNSINNISLDISNLSKGLYLININDGETSSTQKFLKK